MDIEKFIKKIDKFDSIANESDSVVNFIEGTNKKQKFIDKHRDAIMIKLCRESLELKRKEADADWF